jgi:hypothetical protein
MAIAAVHRKKADLCWELAERLYDERRDEFLCMNMIFNTALHLIEEALAVRDKHPAAQPRGVPHADRDAQLRKYLVETKVLGAEAASLYTELFSTRHTFAEGNIQDRPLIERYMATGRQLINLLRALNEKTPRA